MNNVGECSECASKVSLDEILTCGSCSKKFHASCSEMSHLTKRGLKPAPKPSYVKYFNQIMKYNQEYLGGCFSWTCNTCVDIKNLSSEKFVGDRLSLIEAAFIQQKPVVPLVEKLIKKIDDLPNIAAASVNNQSSGLRSRQGSFSDQTRGGKRSYLAAARSNLSSSNTKSSVFNNKFKKKGN